MKKILGLVIIAGMMTFTACGPSAEEKEAAAKAMQDSIDAAEAQMKAVEEAARQQAIQDSIAAAVPDSAAATTTQSAQ
jgi:protein involved in sex pheromone biosynthesis